MRLFICALILTFCLSNSWAEGKKKSAEKKSYPFLAEVNSERVNIRAGQNINFEIVGKLDKGDQVIVVGHQYEWYKIQLPQSAKSYISEKYIQPLSDSLGLINADKVNIRSGPGIQYSIIGQIGQGLQVHIIEKEKDWYRIVPADKTYGWIADKFLVFKSQDTAQFLAKNQFPAKKNVEKPKVPRVAQPVTVEGYLTRQQKDSQWVLVVKDKEFSYALVGLKEYLTHFVGHKMIIKGKTFSDEKELPLPSLEVDEFNILL